MRRLALLLLLLTTGCAQEAQRPNIVLISMDTFRADRLGCYGNPDGLSPRIDEFATGATRYANAKASSPWTLPSHASLFTGLHPFEHGAHSYRVDIQPFSAGEDAADQVDNVIGLGERSETLAERLQDDGYATAGFVANSVYLVPKYGLSQGFGHYEVVPDIARNVIDHALRWLATRDDADQPFLLFLNFMDTHSPYNTAPREGWADLGTPVESAQLLNELNDIVLSGRAADPEKLSLLAQQYDLSVANLDEQIGRLFDALRERGLFEDSLIVLTSDHGEYLGEHRLIGHSKDVYEEAIAIPLVIRSPGQTVAAVDERPIGLAHVIGRMAQHCGSLEELAGDEWPKGFVIAENHFSRIKDLRRPWGARFNRSRMAIYRAQYKLIHSTDQRHELYDLAEDRREQRNLVRRELKVMRGLQRELVVLVQPRFADFEAITELSPDIEPAGLSEEEIEQLKALGYF